MTTMTTANGPRTPCQRKPHTLNIHDQRYNAHFYSAIASIMALRQTYLKNRFIFVRGEDMIPILKGLGATNEDFDYVQLVSDLTGPDPTLDYRTVTHGRYSIDFASRSIQRLEQQPYTLTVQEDYRRHDSGVPRIFDETPAEMQGNTVVQALLLFKALIFQDIPVTPRDHLDYSAPNWITTLFNARTHTDARAGLQGEPALEGVHSDGSDHTMTVFLGSDNMRPDSAVTFMHDNQETTGVALSQTNPTLIRARVQHRGFLDTLVFVDHDFKHSVTSVYAVDEERVAVRDMLVVFTRKPKVEGHVSGYADTMRVHQREPLEVPMWLP